MREVRSHYDVLGVDFLATTAVIRAAYRRRALQAHPDKGGTKEEFQEVLRAFEVLSSPVLRAGFDGALRRSVKAPSRKRRRSSAAPECGRPDGPVEKASGAAHDLGKPFESPAEARAPGCSAPSPEREAAPRESQSPTAAGEQGATSEKQRTAKARNREEVLDRLRKAVGRLPRDLRREALDAMSFGARSALLASMAPPTITPKQNAIAQKSHATADSCAVAPRSPSETSESMSESEDSEKSDVLAVPTLEMAALEDGGADSSGGDDDGDLDETTCAPAGEVCATLVDDIPIGICVDQIDTKDANHNPKPPKKRSTKSGCRGVITDARGRTPSYQASVAFFNLSVVTRWVHSLELAIEYHAILIAVKQFVTEGSQARFAADPFLLGARVREAVASACAEAGVKLEDLGLGWRACVYGTASVVAEKVKSRFSVDLDEILLQRQMLLVGKRNGWEAFRLAWIQVMMAEVTARETSWGSALSQAKTEAEAVAIVDSAVDRWSAMREGRIERQRLAAEAQAARAVQREARLERRTARLEQRRLREAMRLKRRQQRVALAAAAVDRMLNAELRRKRALRRARAANAKRVRLFMAQTRREGERADKARRNLRWQWMRDPKRTVDELLQGPPAL